MRSGGGAKSCPTNGEVLLPTWWECRTGSRSFTAVVGIDVLGVAKTSLILLGGAATVYACRVLPRPWRLALLAAIALPVLGAPLMISPDHKFTRLILAIVSLVVFSKLADLHHPRSRFPGLREFVSFMGHPTDLVFRRRSTHRPDRNSELKRLAGLLLLFSVSSVLSWFVFQANLGQHSFALEHTLKVLALAPAMVAAANAMASLWRIFVEPSRDPFGNIFTAPTPAEFWRRYNRVMGQFLYENIFRSAGGRRAPIRGTLATFAYSSVVHEYIFGIALESVQGYQTAFFMIQGVAVCATLRIKPKNGWKWLGIALTASFNLVSGTLFLKSLHQAWPLWQSPPF